MQTIVTRGIGYQIIAHDCLPIHVCPFCGGRATFKIGIQRTDNIGIVWQKERFCSLTCMQSFYLAKRP
jgi:hypothetical protein